MIDGKTANKDRIGGQKLNRQPTGLKAGNGETRPDTRLPKSRAGGQGQ